MMKSSWILNFFIFSTVCFIFICGEFCDKADKEDSCKFNKISQSHQDDTVKPKPDVNATSNTEPRHESYQAAQKNREEVHTEAEGSEKKLMEEFFPGTGILNTFESLSNWVEKEEIIFSFAKARQQKLKEELKILDEYIDDYESTTEQAVKHSRRPLETPKDRADFIASSGIASYRMTYRYVHMLQRLRELMAFNFLDADLLEILWDKKPGSSHNDREAQYFRRPAGAILPDWPNRLDLALGMHAFTHIQEVYNYDYNDLPIVLAPETRKPPQLNAFHCAQIGLHALYKEHYAVAVEWIEHAIKKVQDEYDSSISLSDLEAYLELTSEAHNELYELAMRTGQSHAIENLFTKPVQPFVEHGAQRQRLTTLYMRRHGGKKDRKFGLINYQALCSGHNFQTPAERAALYCWYDTTSSPARRILPYKKELISANPEVVQVYEFIGDKMINKVLSLTKDCMSTSSVGGASSYLEVVRTRTAVSCWPPENSLPNLVKKVESLTLTDLREPGVMEDIVQVAEYLYGGFYNIHIDALDTLPTEEQRQRAMGTDGDRLFSVLFYFNDVAVGGRTPFINAGTTATPTKGSVVIWYNTYRNGTGRRDTYHGSCPVIYGKKQIGSLVIRYNSQFRTYPCPLDRFK